MGFLSDLSHLSALELRLFNEKRRLQAATRQQEIELRTIWVQQIEKEIAEERERLKITATGPAVPMTDDELLAALGV
ncbi:hypothetical protein [Nitratireductor rhodophyticola]|uniref:hypothetical protein n=1 Tax=Nitratireductor rhodophyticola TaxID=2854036 RepID=UPI003BA90EDA